MKKTLCILPAFILLLSLLLTACAPKEATEAPASATKEKVKSSGETAPAWQSEWDQLVSEAKKEGNIALYAMFTPPTRTALTAAFKQKYGIDLEVTVGRNAEIAEKLLRENRAGLNYADVVIAGKGSAFEVYNPAGLLTTLDPLLLLPEVKDPAAWWQGKLPHLEDTTTLAFIAYVQPPMVVNTDMVKPAELSSLKDLLNPGWKGKITMNDPSAGGTGFSWFAVFSEILGYDYMRSLARMDVVFINDRRLQVEWVARGKYPLGLATMEAEVTEFTKLGAPLRPVIPQEGSYLTHGAGVVSVFAKAPHPKAAKLFVNWLLSREGQTIYSRAEGNQSARVDVSTDHLPSDKVREPGRKYFLEDLRLRPEKQKMVKEIFGPLLK
ncbi:MAG: extracellular solute-binding protein [Chloroflexi bacterium]|nr:extracellular solute-binding protein [Chloroflexota bacterium]